MRDPVPVQSFGLDSQMIDEARSSAAVAETVENLLSPDIASIFAAETVEEATGWTVLDMPKWELEASFWPIESAPWKINLRKYRDSMLQAVFEVYPNGNAFKLANGKRNDVTIANHLRNLERGAKIFHGDTTNRAKLLDYADRARAIEQEEADRAHMVTTANKLPVAVEGESVAGAGKQDREMAIARLKARLVSAKGQGLLRQKQCLESVLYDAAKLGICVDTLGISSETDPYSLPDLSSEPTSKAVNPSLQPFPS